MIQFNLLPDIKKKYIQAKRTKRLIVSVSTIVAAAAIVLTGLLYSVVQIAQKNNISDLTDDIASETAALQAIPDLDKILTIQNQIGTLNRLHETKPESSRIFNYLSQVTPEAIKIQEVILDFEAMTLSVAGSADSLASVNQYADTLKFAKYKTPDIEEGIPFTSVVSELSRSDDNASYAIDMTFDPILFDNTIEAELVIPKQITTRSNTEKPDVNNSLFEDSEVQENQ